MQHYRLQFHHVGNRYNWHGHVTSQILQSDLKFLYGSHNAPTLSQPKALSHVRHAHGRVLSDHVHQYVNDYRFRHSANDPHADDSSHIHGYAQVNRTDLDGWYRQYPQNHAHQSMNHQH